MMTINLRAQFLELLSKYNYFISCFKNIIQRIGIYAYAILFIVYTNTENLLYVYNNMYNNHTQILLYL